MRESLWLAAVAARPAVKAALIGPRVDSSNLTCESPLDSLTKMSATNSQISSRCRTFQLIAILFLPVKKKKLYDLYFPSQSQLMKSTLYLNCTLVEYPAVTPGNCDINHIEHVHSLNADPLFHLHLSSTFMWRTGRTAMSSLSSRRTTPAQ